MKFGDIEFDVDIGVYPPAEDTYLLLNAIELKAADRFLEVGCGTGIISLAAARIAESVVSLDVSIDAVRNTIKNLRTNCVDNRSVVIQSDLLTALGPGAKFSVIAFNPPYLPEDENTTVMDHALVGGPVGIELTQRFIQQAVRHLERNGRIYVVVSSLANSERVVDTMRASGLHVSALATEKMFFESIQILCGNA